MIMISRFLDAITKRSYNGCLPLSPVFGLLKYPLARFRAATERNKALIEADLFRAMGSLLLFQREKETSASVCYLVQLIIVALQVLTEVWVTGTATTGMPVAPKLCMRLLSPKLLCREDMKMFFPEVGFNQLAQSLWMGEGLPERRRPHGTGSTTFPSDLGWSVTVWKPVTGVADLLVATEVIARTLVTWSTSGEETG
ncbi:hypothetical protein K435DRAFT_812978 [Dendrothele bispora CBS 962.96]|uniref:Uncharacterized protein n=1 Tax=Dendrothele bispora (strain CBS 962.96) TaxID=1314807 RepID=A0A4S8KMU8_DENBC|nr:hypothetical protein K435DRAFT_812978 [Dendrothele bispora CBS 962.96]